MVPTLLPGDRVLVVRGFGPLRPALRVGDLVALVDPRDAGTHDDQAGRRLRRRGSRRAGGQRGRQHRQPPLRPGESPAPSGAGSSTATTRRPGGAGSGPSVTPTARALRRRSCRGKRASSVPARAAGGWPFLLMRALLRTLIVAGLCWPWPRRPGPPGAVTGPTGDELQRRADSAAVRYDRAVATLGRLGDDIARLERKIGEAETRMAPLRANVTRRAVAVYTSDRGLDAFSGLRRRGRSGRIGPGGEAGLRSQRPRLRRHQDDRRRHRRDGPAPRRAGRPAGRAAAGDRRPQGRAAERRDWRWPSWPSGSGPSRPGWSPGPAAGSGRPAEGPTSGPIPVVTDFICPIRGPMTFTDTWGAPRAVAAGATRAPTS